MRGDVLTRFWAKVDRAGDCWTWKAGTKNGYGQFYAQPGIPLLAHRFSYETYVGPIKTGLFICHKCDTRPCVRPSHLFMGTPMDNMRDMWDKGRGPAHNHHGERNPSAKLTQVQVNEIRQRYVPRVVTAQSLADEFGVSRTEIKYILARKVWRAQ